MSLTKAVGGIFPIVSFLHVPKQMPQPQWLVLGTAYLLHVDSLPTAKKALGNSNNDGRSPSGGLLDRIKARSKAEPLLLLSVAHNFAPWRVPDWKLNIPDDWRKLRYITSNVYQYDVHGACIKDSATKVSFEALHPTLDLALLSVPDGGQFISQLAKASSATGDDNDFNLRMSQFKIETVESFHHRNKKSSHSEQKQGGDGVVLDAIGFRGRGSLGDTRLMGEEQTQKLSAEERHKLVESHRDAVGKQDVHVFTFSPQLERPGDYSSGEKGAGYGTQGNPFIGMSGSACVPRRVVAAPFSGGGASASSCDGGGAGGADDESQNTRIRTSCGIFYGGEINAKRLPDGSSSVLTEGEEGGGGPSTGSSALYVPGQDILKWFEDIL